MSIVSKSQRSTIKFGSTIQVDGYLMPNGEFRVGIASASISVGYAKNYLGRLADSAPKQLEALQLAGYTGLLESATLDMIGGGGASAETISLADYRELIIFASEKGKKPAQALNRALMQVSLDDFFRTSFAIPLMSMAEKKVVIETIIHSFYLEHQWEIDNRRLPGDDLYLPKGIN